MIRSLLNNNLHFVILTCKLFTNHRNFKVMCFLLKKVQIILKSKLFKIEK